MENKLEQFHQFLVSEVAYWEDRMLNAPTPNKADSYEMLYNLARGIEREFVKTFLQTSPTVETDEKSDTSD